MELILHLFAALIFMMTANQIVEAKPTCLTLEYSQDSRWCVRDITYEVDCRNLSLTMVPKSYPEKPDKSIVTCALDLSLNNFTVLLNGTFSRVKNLKTSGLQELILSSSNIHYISSTAFQGLNNLKYLNLLNNHLSFPNGLGEGVFKPLISLINLNIKENKISTFDGFGEELSYMKDLEGIFVELCDGCKFGKAFTELHHLNTVSLSGRYVDACNVPVLHNDTFEGLIVVESLFLSFCNISKIEADAFRPMNNSLVKLDISYNEELCFHGMNTALYGLRFSTKLSTLKVNRIHNVHEIGVELRSSHLENLSTLKKLAKLYMDFNKIEIFDEGIFRPVCIFPPSLRVVTFAENRISYGVYFNSIYYATNITCIDISRQHLYYDPFKNEYDSMDNQIESITDRACFKELKHFQNKSQDRGCSITIPPNLRRVKWRKSFLNFDLDLNVTICQATNLVHLDLSFNLFTKWRASIKGLERLKHLDLSENYCSEVSPGFFDHFNQLEYLNLSGNNLRTTFESTLTDKSIDIFGKLKHLLDIDLSNNGIESFSDPDIFKQLTNIQQLRLHSNRLSDWNLRIPDSKSLQFIDMSQNKLTNVPEELTCALDKICLGNSCNLTISLMNNAFECDCDNLHFFKWILSTKVKVKLDICRLNTRERSIKRKLELKQLVNNLERSVCSNMSWMTGTVGTLSVVLGSFISLVIVSVIYRNRWKIRYLYYRRNRRFNHEGFERLFEYDAFVSYSKRNASFLKNYMVPALEKDRNLHLWVADRNAMAGTSIAENIIFGINSSRKSVLLVDKAYLKDSWCDYELNMAHTESVETKRKLIIIVLMDDVAAETLPINIMRILRSERSLEYPENSEDLDTFWAKLADEIMC